jgi:hypothetical protein
MGNLIDQLGVPPQRFEAVGKVAASWSFFEAMLDISIWNLACMSKEFGACLVAQIAGSARKLDAIIALIKLKPEHEKKITELNKIAENSQRLGERRNRVVHDPWMGDATGTYRLEATARKILKLQPVAVSDDEIGKLIVDISDHTKRYMTLMAEFIPGVLP